MSTYLFVHGSWHGGWCWDKITSLLKSQGHTAISPDLPSHGNDKTPIQEVTLELYTDCVCNVLDSQTEPVILVGHSMGGLIISQVAEYRPEKIRKLVYLTAFMLKNGESTLQVVMQDVDSLLVKNLVMSDDQMSSNVKKDMIKEVFYHDCTEEDFSNAISLLVPQSSVPLGTPISLTDEKFGQIPKVYIECLDDRVITPSVQKKMYTDYNCEQIITINSSHSPFFSFPDELASHLISFS